VRPFLRRTIRGMLIALGVDPGLNVGKRKTVVLQAFLVTDKNPLNVVGGSLGVVSDHQIEQAYPPFLWHDVS